MKVLVIQLARFGDIFQTWPTIKALQRSQNEVHLLCRRSFASAAETLNAISKLWTLDVKDILVGREGATPEVDQMLGRLNPLLQELREQKFDRIINLSFSPASSRLVKILENPGCEVSGYTRTEDDFLAIPDDPSAYFYSQVGVRKANRIHITDLFAEVAGVNLLPSDFMGAPSDTGAKVSAADRVMRGCIVVHPGASQTEKTLHWSVWAQVVRSLIEHSNQEVVIIGSESERGIGKQICSIAGLRKPTNLVGDTNLSELFSILRKASILVGADSAPIHIAALVGTPVLNLSLPSVNFWETGPKSAGSYVIRVGSDQDLEKIGDIAVRMAHGLELGADIVKNLEMYYRASLLGDFTGVAGSKAVDVSFGWDLLRALYLGEQFPSPRSVNFLTGIGHLSEVNKIAIQQIEALQKNPSLNGCQQVLLRVDETIEAIVRVVPDLDPIVSWFNTERKRIGPLALQEVFDRTLSLHRKLGQILAVYNFEMEGALNDHTIVG